MIACRGTQYYEGNIYGTPSLAQKSGNFSFNLVNIVEAKIFERNDTTGKPKKIKLIDNFSMGTSYNIFADSLRWAPVSVQLRTTLFNNINISASSSFSLYGTNPTTGAPIGKFLIATGPQTDEISQISVPVLILA